MTFLRRPEALSGVELKRETIVDVDDCGGFVLLQAGDFILTDARGVDHPVKRHDLVKHFTAGDASAGHALEASCSPLLDPLRPGTSIELQDRGRRGLSPVLTCTHCGADLPLNLRCGCAKAVAA